jgi:hypothetical protein
MTDRPRYPVTPKHPPLHTRVLVSWNGRTFKASRVVHPREKRYCWVRRFDDGREAYLPPKGKGKSKKQMRGEWTPDPQWWMPEQPDKWDAPLPPAIPEEVIPEYRRMSDEPRMVDIRRRRKRSGIQLAPEKDAVPAERSPWWWDATRIVFEPFGQI